MTAIQVFNHEEFGELRTVEQNGEIWFVAADVCRTLDVKNLSDALTKLEDDEKMTLDLTEGNSGQRGGAQMLNVVNEAGLYRLIFTSRKPNAKKFRYWTFHDVLPSIRKTGKYSIRQAYAPATDAFKDARTLADEIRSVNPNVQFGIALSKAVDVVEKVHNVSLQAVKEILPPAEHETGYLNATQIGQILGIKPRQTNLLIAEEGFIYKLDGMWRLTEAGKAYGEEIPYTRNGHSGYQIRWNEKIVDVLRERRATA